MIHRCSMNASEAKQIAKRGYEALLDVLQSVDSVLDSYEAREEPWTTEWYHLLRKEKWAARAYWPGFVHRNPTRDHDLVVSLERDFKVEPATGAKCDLLPNFVAIEAKRWWVAKERWGFAEDWEKLGSSRCKYRMWVVAVAGFRKSAKNEEVLEELDASVAGSPFGGKRVLTIIEERVRWRAGDELGPLVFGCWYAEAEHAPAWGS